MRELALAGFVALGFGLGSYYATGDLGTFSVVNLLLVILRGLLGIAVALALGVGLERAASWSELRLDWTFEQRFEISPAVRTRLAELQEPVTATLYYDALDPRVRRTRLLLRTIASAAPEAFLVREHTLDEHPAEADRFEVSSSNSVVLERGERWQTVARPTEGTLYEALYRLDTGRRGTLVLLRGEGEGDPERGGKLGYSGFAAALATEGYTVSSRVSAALTELPEDTDAVIVIAPHRRLLATALDALRRYLARGGRLVALLEPGRESGVEELLSEYGIDAPPRLVVDPASGPVEESGAQGIGVVAFNYEVHPLTRGLDTSRMTYFPGVRPLLLRKPRAGDEVKRIVLSSRRAWVTSDLGWLERRSGRPQPEGDAPGFQTLVAAGRYPREDGDARVVVFGDAGFASNRYLRTLYNLDLILNAVHWATDREPAITLRPKIRRTVQFPVPLANSVRAFYGVGLLIPELLLIAGGIVWLRRRSA
jgi:ABC-type uncharacterized transport system involved in gliding motility auxiliary subunit